MIPKNTFNGIIAYKQGQLVQYSHAGHELAGPNAFPLPSHQNTTTTLQQPTQTFQHFGSQFRIGHYFHTHKQQNYHHNPHNHQNDINYCLTEIRDSRQSPYPQSLSSTGYSIHSITRFQTSSSGVGRGYNIVNNGPPPGDKTQETPYS